MKFAQTFIKHHVMTILLYILVVVFGFYSFQNLPLALMPSMEVPAAVVYATYPGAGPEDIEQQVTKKLEGAVAGLSGLDTLQSTSSENMAMLVIRFTNDTDMDQAMTDLRDKVAQVKSQLPDDASDPTVMSIDIDSMPVVSVALRGNDLASLQSIAEDEIQPALERLDGVASVDISGGYEQEIAVHTDASRLKGYNLTISSIGQQLGADNIAIPGGDLDNGSQTLAVRTDGEYSSIDDVKNALISLPAGGTVRLSQIADVSMQPKDQDAISKVDGEECIILSVNKQSGSNTVQIAELAKAEFDSLLKSNDSLQWNIVMDQSDYINMTVDNAIQNIWMGVLFAAVVLFVFLRDFGATLAVTIAMPCCILFTFLIMNVLGITLNMMSLGGITLGVGMIVDNSIVVLENIFSYRADGYDRLGRLHEGHGRGHDVGHGVHADHDRRIPADRTVGRHDRHDVQGILYHHRRAAAQLADHFHHARAAAVLFPARRHQAAEHQAAGLGRNADHRKAAVACIPQFAEFPDHPPLGRRRADRCHLYCQRAQRQPGGHGAYPGDG